MSLPREPLWGSTGGNGHTSPSVALTRQTAPCGCSQGIAKPGIQQSGISPSPSISQQLLLPAPCPASPAFPRCRGTLLYTLVNTSRANTLSHQPSSNSPGHGPTLPWGCSGLAQPHSPSTPGRDTPWTCSRARVHHHPRLDPELLPQPWSSPLCFPSPPASPGCVCLQVMCTCAQTQRGRDTGNTQAQPLMQRTGPGEGEQGLAR